MHCQFYCVKSTMSLVMTILESFCFQEFNKTIMYCADYFKFFVHFFPFLLLLLLGEKGIILCLICIFCGLHCMHHTNLFSVNSCLVVHSGYLFASPLEREP